MILEAKNPIYLHENSKTPSGLCFFTNLLPHVDLLYYMHKLIYS